MAIDLNTSQFTKTYDTFSGADIQLVMHNTLVGNANGISFSITREKAPIYVLGSVDAVSISRGKRGIAGSLIMYNTDRSALYEYMEQAWYASHAGDLPAFGGDNTNWRSNTADTTPSAANTIAGGTATSMALIRPNYSDQIPPFDISLTAQNEYGQAASMAIFGVEILNEGEGHSVDDITSETQMTFICRSISLWHPATRGANDTVDTTFASMGLPTDTIAQLLRTTPD